MKRKLLCFITAIVMLFALGAVAIGCNDSSTPNTPNTPDGSAVEYSVTVKAPDGTPIEGVIVSWQNSDTEYGKATTDANGKATATLAPATYKLVLSGLAAGLTAHAVSQPSNMRDITLNLSYAKVEYTATVIDKSGAPANNVTVTWVAGTTVAGTAKTDANGVAKCTLDYGDYSVTVSDLPQGNIANGALDASGSSPAVRFELDNGETTVYTLTVRSEGGLKFAKTPIRVFGANGILAALGDTDENGMYTFTQPTGEYRATIVELPDGYTASNALFDANNTSAEITAYSKIIDGTPTGADFFYVMGDIFHDYTFTTPYNVKTSDGSEGEPISLTVSEILKTKKMLILNNWGTNCSYCVQEMPAMESVYQKYKDDIEIVAVSNYQGGDSNSTIERFYADNEYTFPLLRDTYGFDNMFNITGWPTTVIIDRYGAIARIERGALDSEGLWERIISTYAADDYVQTFKPGDRESESIRVEISKPDITVPADHYEQIEQTLNNTAEFPEGATVKWYGAPDNEEYQYAWPFVLGTEPDVSPNERVLYSPNIDKHNSYSVLFATVNVPAGSVFTFDYFAQTESGRDVLSILWDGKLIHEISGDSNGWQTCKLYADITADSHTLAMTYMKDSTFSVGKDTVFIRNVRFTSLSDITGSANMLRAAAYGTPAEGADRYPHYASVTLDTNDGYYHVNTAALENANLAGNDNSPLLLANLTKATNWMGSSISELLFLAYADTGEYIFDTNLTVNGVTRDYRQDLIDYVTTATYSDIPNYVPVDKELHDLLIAFMARVKQTLAEQSADSDNPYDGTLHDNEWLEVCYFYSHYGDGDPIGNPIIGLTEKTAELAQEGTNTAVLTRNMYPFPAVIFSFTPEESAVYKLESLLPANSQQSAQIWLYDDNSSATEPLAYCGDTHVTRNGVNEHNFELYAYLTAGHKYYFTVAFQMQDRGTFDFSLTNVGQSATVLMPAADAEYVMILDENEQVIGVEVSNPVKYEKDNDGYYHALNPDGTMGSIIYLDAKYPIAAMGTISVEAMLDKNMIVYADNNLVTCEFKTFDFSKTFVNFRNADGDLYQYDTNYDMTQFNGSEGITFNYRDCTERLRELIAAAPTEGETAGMIPITDEIVEILGMFTQLRTNTPEYNDTYNAVILEQVLENEWLRYCWYFRQYDSNNI